MTTQDFGIPQRKANEIRRGQNRIIKSLKENHQVISGLTFISIIYRNSIYKKKHFGRYSVLYI